MKDTVKFRMMNRNKLYTRINKYGNYFNIILVNLYFE